MPWDRSFSRELDRLRRDAERIIRGTARAGALGIITYTPVDTGRLVGNWQGAINAEPPTARVQDDPGKQFTRSFFEVLVRQIGLGDRFVMTNATPYAGFVNDGTSRTRPRMMLERGLADAVSFARSAASRL